MIYDSVLSRHELFIATATVGAHSNAAGDTFRQRDVKFLIELFSNWVETSFESYSLSLQNTQVARYIQHLVAEGYARKISRKGRPTYRLTRTGLIELISRLVDRTYVSEREHFFFLYYFLRNYSPRLTQMVQAEGKQFPPALRIELESLLDTEALLRRELKAARAEITKLDERMQDALSTSKLVSEGLKQGRELEEMVLEAEKHFPYELNSQKPLSELIAGIPEAVRAWELEFGNRLRVQEIWRPGRELLVSYVGALEGLVGNDKG